MRARRTNEPWITKPTKISTLTVTPPETHQPTHAFPPVSCPVPVLCFPLSRFPLAAATHAADSYFIFSLAGTQLDQRQQSATREARWSVMLLLGFFSSFIRREAGCAVRHRQTQVVKVMTSYFCGDTPLLREILNLLRTIEGK
jgi:hypothetical protein